MQARLLLVAVLAACVNLFALTGCGEGDLVFPGMALPTMTVTPIETPTCLPSGDACVLASDCCSGSCITVVGVNFTCQ